jgi:hypothetical protein
MYESKLILGVLLSAFALAAPVHADRGHAYAHGGGDREWSNGHFHPRHQALTRSEARQLKKKRRRLSQRRDAYLEDGELTKKERRLLRQKRANLRHLAYEFKHNDRTRRDDRDHHRYGIRKRRHAFDRYLYHYPAFGLSFIFSEH